MFIIVYLPLLPMISSHAMKKTICTSPSAGTEEKASTSLGV